MPDKNNLSANAMRKANAYFTASAEKDASLREELAAAKAARLAQIAELRALRIARDAKKKTADQVQPESPPLPTE